MGFCLIRGIFEVNSPAIDRKNNEEVGKKTFILFKWLYLDNFLNKGRTSHGSNPKLATQNSQPKKLDTHEEKYSEYDNPF